MLEQFLAKDEWRKYQILKLLERNAFFSINKHKLMDYLEVSSYVLKGIIEALSYDLVRYELDQAIQLIDEEPYIQLQISGKASSETLLENYAKDSLRFRLLCSAYLEKYNSVNDFSINELISYPIAYKEYKQLNQILQTHNIQLSRKFQLVSSDEQNLRLFMTELFVRILKDDLSFYANGDLYLVKQQIAILPFEQFTLHQKTDLIHYCYVTDTRLRQKHYLKDTKLPLLSGEMQTQICLSFFFSQVPEALVAIEKQAFVNYYMTRSVHLMDQIIQYDLSIMEFSQQLVSAIKKAFPVLSNYPEEIALFIRCLNFLHLQVSELSTSYESLQPVIDISYFQQNYPEILTFCRHYMESLKKTLLYKKKKFVFFNYLLLVVNTFPKEALLDLVKIHVDFSYGERYNDFIKSNLFFFQTSGAVITDNLKDADILLTDNRSFGETSSCQYVVWLSPPRPLDWANLGQKIVEQRQKNIW
ncbi:helix-turn-helix domain-containing protein [Enterococcus sp. AZ109]|uniref:helix-turn-helix domain-containing protein n=1 Tax=Enterococcus sp. AZ109 TaxID=2774634 RepID=UPI003F29CCD2